MAHEHEHDAHEGHGASACALSGCGEVEAVERAADEAAAHVAPPAQRRRLLRLDELQGETLDGYLTARGRERRSLLRSGGLLAGCAAVGPLFAACATPGHGS